MAAKKTEEDKAADAAQAEKVEEAKAQDAQNEKDAHETAERLAAASAAEAQTESDNALRAQIREELRQEVLDEQRKAVDKESFYGQLVSTENYIIGTTGPDRAKAVTVRQVGWVGEHQLIVPIDRVDELVKALGQIKK